MTKDVALRLARIAVTVLTALIWGVILFAWATDGAPEPDEVGNCILAHVEATVMLGVTILLWVLHRRSRRAP